MIRYAAPVLTVVLSTLVPAVASALPTVHVEEDSRVVGNPTVVSAPAPVQAAPVVPTVTAPAPVSADKGTSEPQDPSVRSPEGFVVSIGGGAQYTGGELARGVGLGAVLGTIELGAGAYLTPNLGLLGGVRFGYLGFTTAGCDGCAATSLQIPVVAQYAFEGRQKGAYLEAGVGFLTSVNAIAKSSKGDAKLGASSAADLKLGFGYRFLHGTKEKKPVLPGALDLKLGLDVGRYSEVALEAGSKSARDEIPEEGRAIHWGLGLSLAYVVTP